MSVSWMELMDEEEKINKKVCHQQDVNPTPSKLLAGQIDKFHMLTPIKCDETPATAINSSISFNIDATGLNENEKSLIKSANIPKLSKTKEYSPVPAPACENKIRPGSKEKKEKSITEKEDSEVENGMAASGKVARDKAERSQPSSVPTRQARTVRRSERLPNAYNPSRSTDANDAPRKRLRPDSVSSSTSSRDQSKNSKKRAIEVETDPDILDRRQKQIDFGKNTIGYERYLAQVPKNKRTGRHPSTPQIKCKYSRRAWDGLIKIWRQQLHFWDPETTVPDDNAVDSEPESHGNNSLDGSLLLTD